jgi:Family of unknown function (DUF6807)
MQVFPRCQVLPLADHQTAILIDGQECLRWHYGPSYPRPFFYPIVGPSGSSLTRMGHPGASNHDHHRSVWFAHNKVLGIDFWSDNTLAQIRQPYWLAYEDGDEEALLATRLHWHDGHDPAPLLEQDLIAAVRPLADAEWVLDLQSTFTPKADSLEFGQTNFGFLAVRVAKNLSEYFGGGKLTSSEGPTGESAIFGTKAKWMDYSGPIPALKPGGNDHAWEGITYFDHPQNPGYPTHWHVREDGWMGASVGMKTPITTTREQPLVLRYLLHVHAGPVDKPRSDKLAQAFAEHPGYVVEKGVKKHHQWTARRK